MGSKLIKGNCLEELVKLGDDSADLMITSPPYNMNLRISNGKYCSRQITKELTTKYKNYDDNLPIEEYFQMNKKIITEGLRVAPIIFYNVQFLTGNKRAFYRLIGEFANNLKEIIVWDKMNGQPAIGQRVMNSRFEFILIFERDNSISRAFKSGVFQRGTLDNLWQIKRGKKPLREHGAVFPDELVEKIIDNFSVDGDTVIDPFMGSGTTGRVAIKKNRNFIGIEIDEDYFNFSKETIEKNIV